MARTLDKATGISVFPLHGEPESDCMLARLLAEEPWRREIPWPDGFAGGIVHRLDIPTSGALWVAEDLVELRRLRQHFADKELMKTYLLLAARDVPWDQNACRAAIAHAKRKRGRMVVQRGPHTPHRGRWYPAETGFQRVRGRVFAARMCTGVMHQIRVHAAFVGIPLQGDRRYGGGSKPVAKHAPFCLHHVGLVGPRGLATDTVSVPSWAEALGDVAELHHHRGVI